MECLKIERSLATEKIELKEKYVSTTFLFMAEAYNILGGPAQTIFESTVKGYNERFNKDIRIDDTIHLSDLTGEEWPKFIEFLLNISYQCVGPVTFECCKEMREIPEIKEIVERAEGKLKNLIYTNDGFTPSDFKKSDSNQHWKNEKEVKKWNMKE